MNILLTNDDGIESEGILKLAETLRSSGRYNVFILAPDVNRSGVSGGLTIFNPVRLQEKAKGNWTCSGMPVDCVIAAVLGGKPCKPDLVISGINHGANLGSDIMYSGTTAAARQAAFMGIPGIALSLGNTGSRIEYFHWDMAVNYAADNLEKFINMWRKDIFINVNIPNNAAGPDGMAVTWPACKTYNDTLDFIRSPFGEWCYMVPGRETAANQAGSDWEAISANIVSVSPVCIQPAVPGDLCPNAPDYAAAGKRSL